jgi:hypothetical protein
MAIVAATRGYIDAFSTARRRLGLDLLGRDPGGEDDISTMEKHSRARSYSQMTQPRPFGCDK